MAEKEEVKLLGMWSSPYSRRVEMALKLKGVPYEYVEEYINNKSPLLLELNPVHKKVPVLIHNGKPIAESLVILEYIDETWKNHPILPEDPYQRAMARFWANFIDEKIVSIGAISVVKAPKGREAAVEETQELIKFLEKELSGKEFFGEKTIGFLDIVAATMIPFGLVRLWKNLEIEMVPKKKFPDIHRWIKNLSQIDTVKECIPPEEEHVKLMVRAIEAIKSA